MSNSIIEVLYHQIIPYNNLSYNSLEKINLKQGKKYDSIKDIKDYNDKEKTFLAMFINKYININPLVSKYNKYIDFLFEPYNMLKYKPILRGYYNALLILDYSKIPITKTKILQVGILPTFIEAYFTLSNNDYSYTYNFIKIESNNLGFVRIEVENNIEYITDICVKLDNIINLNEEIYCVNDKNPYCAFWIYNKNEFNNFVNSKYYNINNISDYGTREQSAIGLHGLSTDWYKNTLIPIINNKLIEECKIYHMPNNYVLDKNTCFAKIKFDEVLKLDV